MNDNSSKIIYKLNPEASNFTPNEDTQVKQPITPDEQDTLPEHINLLYETTIKETNLLPEVEQQLKQLLTKHKNTFAKSTLDMGYCNILEHDVDTGDHRPIKQPPRRPPLSSGDAEEKIVQDMLKAGIIQESKSEWASPVVLVKKPDNSYRFCVDYRRVNAITFKDAFPTTNIQDALDSLRGSRYFCTLDLLQGYWQIPNSARARERSAFCTRTNLYEFTRLPFGMTGAPATFCRVMQKVLGDLTGKIAISYIDDIIIFGRTQSELLDRLDQVLTRLQEHGLKVKPTKCSLFKTEIKFLGHLVNESGIKPLPDKLEAIKYWPVPRCVRETKAFYGLCSYYRKFIKNFAQIAHPLTNLTKKFVRFSWSDAEQNSFEQLKSALLDAPILAYPHPHVECIVDTDVSGVAIGGCVSQVIEGTERPIAFFSRVLSDSQTKYCPTKRELLAAVLTLQHFRHYLLHVPVKLRTDHHSLLWLKTFKSPEGMLARWLETFAEFDLHIEHRAGRTHCNADALSRQYCKQCWGKPQHTDDDFDELARANEIAEPLGINQLQILPEISETELAELQDADTIISPVKTWLELDYSPTEDEIREIHPEARKLWSNRQLLKITDNILVRTSEKGHQLIVPNSLRQRLFDAAHSSPLAGHLGNDKTVGQLKEHYYWPGMTVDVRMWTHSCDTCCRTKGPPNKAQGKLTKVHAAAPMDLVAIDLLSGLPTADDNSKYILVVVDYYTRWVEAYSLPNEEASTCFQALYTNFFSKFGFPSQLHSDQGRQFESRLFHEMARITGMRKTRTSPYHPRGNGLVERFNRTLLSMLRAMAIENPHDWPQKLPALTSAYRACPHKITKMTANELMLGRNVQTPVTLIAKPPNEKDEVKTPFARDLRNSMREAHIRVRQTTNTSARLQKRYFDARTRSITFVKGEYVYVYSPNPLLRQKRRKLTPLWSGPWRIEQFITDVVVKVKHLTTKKTQNVHVDRLSKCHSVPALLNSDTQNTQAASETTQPNTNNTQTSPQHNGSDQNFEDDEVDTDIPQEPTTQPTSSTQKQSTQHARRRSKRVIIKPLRYRHTLPR